MTVVMHGCPPALFFVADCRAGLAGVSCSGAGWRCPCRVRKRGGGGRDIGSGGRIDLSGGRNDLSYGRDDLSYGWNDLSYGRDDLSYGRNDLSDGRLEDIFLLKGDVFFQADDMFLQAEDIFLQADGKLYQAGDLFLLTDGMMDRGDGVFPRTDGMIGLRGRSLSSDGWNDGSGGWCYFPGQMERRIRWEAGLFGRCGCLFGRSGRGMDTAIPGILTGRDAGDCAWYAVLRTGRSV